MKTLKIVQIILLMVLAVGLITVMVVAIAGNFSFGDFFSGRSVEIFDKDFDSAGVKSIVFDITSSDVEVLYSDTEKIRVVYQGAEKEVDDSSVSAEVKADTLRIEQENRKTWFQWGVNRKVTIYLPESFQGKFEYSCSSGDLVFSENFSFSEIITKSSSGDFKAADLTCEKFQATLSSGDIILGALQAPEFSFTLTSGDISVAELHGGGSLTLTSGDVAIEGFYGNGNFKTTSGDIMLGIREATGDVEIKVTSGDVIANIYEGNAFRCDFSATSGDITTAFGSDSAGNFGDSFSGSIGEDPVNALKIHTTSGDILVTAQ
jgi:DUF4097 and DUF4098 domain-containing protein YvlB